MINYTWTDVKEGSVLQCMNTTWLYVLLNMYQTTLTRTFIIVSKFNKKLCQKLQFLSMINIKIDYNWHQLHQISIKYLIEFNSIKCKKGIFLNKSTLSNLPIIFTFYLTWSLWILIIYIFILVSLPPNIIQRINLLNLFWIKLKWFHIMTKHWKSFLVNHQTNNVGYQKWCFSICKNKLFQLSTF